MTDKLAAPVSVPTRARANPRPPVPVTGSAVVAGSAVPVRSAGVAGTRVPAAGTRVPAAGTGLPVAGAGVPARRRRWWPRLGALGLLALWGPGLVVMLADTDAGSLITAAQSGAQWGYRMLAPQLILIPILYLVQEMTVRIGIVTGQGHGALIRARFGRGWAILSATTLFVSVIGALLTEYAGIAGVGQLFGIPRAVSVPTATALLLALAVTGSYQRVERIGMAIGAAELALIAALLLTHPRLHPVLHALSSMPLTNHSYLILLAANTGAVIMPWMVFYQQGAVIDKRLSTATIRQARQDTATGAVLTQIIMIAMVVAVAATIGTGHPGSSLSTVGQIADALTSHLGHLGGTVLFGTGMLAAALVSAIVASLAGAWGLAEVFGWPHTLNQRPNRHTAKFYATYAAAHLAGAGLVLASIDLIRIAVDVEVMNALLLPIVLGLLLALEAKALPPQWRMRGARRYTTWTACLITIGFGLYMIPSTLGLT